MLKIIATVLMLLEAFNCIRPLIIFLQKGQYSLHINQAQTVAHLTLLNLKNALHKKSLTKLIHKLLSKFYHYPCQQIWDVIISNFHHFRVILIQSLSPPLKQNSTKHLDKCITGNVFRHLILKDCQKISAKLQDMEMASLKSW